MNLQVLRGSLLGDAYIQNTKANCYAISFQQSEFDYAQWKANMCGLDYTLTKRKRFDKRTGKSYYNYSVYLKLDKKYKKELYQEFYSSKKRVTKELLNSLTDLSIAIWYMDDGSLYYNGNNCHLSLGTNCFDEESLGNILNFFKNKYSINFKLNKNNSMRITSRRDTELFMNIVEKFIPKCMKRKTFKYAFNKYDKTLSDERRKCRNNKYKG